MMAHPRMGEYCGFHIHQSHPFLFGFSPGSFVFMGARIVRAVIADLIQRQGLLEAQYIVFAGNR